MLNQSAIACLELQLAQMNSVITTGTAKKRELWVLIDKYLEKTGDYSNDAVRGEQANKLGDKSKIATCEIPITFINKETAHAYLAGTFLTGYPIFSATTKRSLEDAASQINALVKRDQQRMQWIPELLRGLDDVLRYNVIACEILWKDKRGSAIGTKAATAKSPTTGVVNPIVYSGNSITRIDPYNLILDPNVEPSKVHIDGTYAGYIESMDYIQLKRKYLEWKDVFMIKKNIGTIFGGSKASTSGAAQYTNLYYKPMIAKQPTQGLNGGNFQFFFGYNSTTKLSNSYNGKYEVVTLYKRVIPKEYEMVVPNSGTPQVYCFIWVNGYLAYAEPISAGHEYLPIVVGQLYPGDIDKKSFTEYLTDLQDLATSMMAGTLASMRRAVGDRAIYDPSRIRKADIESTSPVSKIPVSTNAYQQGLEGAYKQIPYTDTLSSNFQGLMNVCISLGEKTTGLNGSAQGNFIPGNKTTKEFDTIMSNSAARLQLGSVHLDGNFFIPVKEIIKLNYLTYAKTEEIADQTTDEVVKIDPSALRQQAPEFQMADGLMPATKQASTEVMMGMLGAIQNNPQLSLEYDIGAMIISIGKQQGLTDLNSYKRTPEQQAQYLQQVQAQTNAQNPQQPPTQQPPQQ